MSRAEEILDLHEKVVVRGGAGAVKGAAVLGGGAYGVKKLHDFSKRHADSGNVARKGASKAMSGFHTAKSMSGDAVRKHLGIGG